MEKLGRDKVAGKRERKGRRGDDAQALDVFEIQTLYESSTASCDSDRQLL